MDPNNVGAYLDQSNSDILKVLKTELSGAKPKHAVSDESAADSSSNNNHVYSKTAAKVNNKGAQQQQQEQEKEKQELESKVFSNKDIAQKTQNLQKLTSDLKKDETEEDDDDQEEGEEESGERDSYFASLFDKNNADILKSIKKMIPSRR